MALRTASPPVMVLPDGAKVMAGGAGQAPLDDLAAELVAEAECFLAVAADHDAAAS